MKNALITGSQGFVGGYLRSELEHNGYNVTGLDLQAGAKTLQVDLMELQQICDAVRQTKPDIVIHLAGQADVGRSWKIPQKTLEINVIGAVNLMEALRAWAPATRLVLVGSSDQYGILGAAGTCVSEQTPSRPQTPYAVSKNAQEEMARIYVRAYGMNICMTRSFNHAGVGQREGFLIPDFAAGIAQVEKGLAPCLKVGNLTAKRDFTHVQDVARAYRLIAEAGVAGEVYNVGSGSVHSAQEILDLLCSMARCPIPVVPDPAKMRPSDTPVVCCDHRKLTAHTGWEASISMAKILEDVLSFYRDQLKEV